MRKRQYKIKETNLTKLKAFLNDVSKHKRDRNTCRSNDYGSIDNINRQRRERS